VCNHDNLNLIIQNNGPHLKLYCKKYLRSKAIPDKTFEDYSKCVFEINLPNLNILCKHAYL